MKSPFRVLVVASLVAVCSANPSTLRPLYQLMTNPGACMQRAESLAQVVMRIDSLSHLLRRP